MLKEFISLLRTRCVETSRPLLFVFTYKLHQAGVCFSCKNCVVCTAPCVCDSRRTAFFLALAESPGPNSVNWQLTMNRQGITRALILVSLLLFPATIFYPMSLEVAKMVQAESMLHAEWILCGSCADNCPHGVIRYSFGKPGT